MSKGSRGGAVAEWARGLRERATRARAGRLWPLVYLPVPLLGLWGVIFVSGWPFNHEFFCHFERVEAFRRAYRAGDWFPLWTAFAERGHGDALPLFYHRLFNTLGSLVAIATGSSYVAVKVSVYLVMLVGLWGMDRAVAVIGGSRFHRFVGACLLVFSNYALFDWLVRGSTAEFTAFMLLPWVFYYLLLVLRDERGAVGFGVSMGLLFYAHSAIFYFTVLTVVPIGLVQLGVRICRAARRGEPLLRPLRPFLIAALACALCAGPYALAIALVGPAYSLNALYQAWSPIQQMKPLHWFFNDDTYAWGREWRLEIGRALLAGLAALIALAVAVRARPARLTLGVLLFALAFCAWLQTPLAIPFYRKFPGAMYLGFPWRMLCTLSVALILLLCHLAERIASHGRRAGVLATGILLAVAGYQISFGVAAQRARPDRYSFRAIQARLDDLDIITVGEYLPAAIGGRRGIPARAPFAAGKGCTSVTMGGADPAKNAPINRLELTVTSPSGCRVDFNQFANPLLRVESAAAIDVGTTPERTISVGVPAGTVRLVLAQRRLVPVMLEQARHLLGGP